MITGLLISCLDSIRTFWLHVLYNRQCGIECRSLFDADHLRITRHARRRQSRMQRLKTTRVSVYVYCWLKGCIDG